MMEQKTFMEVFRERLAKFLGVSVEELDAELERRRAAKAEEAKAE